MKIVKPSVTLEWVTEHPECIIERAGRTAYKSENMITKDSAKKFGDMIMRRGHFSVIEHACASLRFICDRGVTHEMVRHRLATYTQESTRYCNYSKDKFGNEITVIEPPFDNDDMGHEWLTTMWGIESVYMKMLNDGVSPQIARSVLPNCLKTEIVMTANFREWCHFLRLRCSKKAHPQMREVALMARDILRNISPTFFGEQYDDIHD